MEVQTPSKKGEYIDHLLRDMASNKGKLKRKDIMNKIEYYVGILTNINLKLVHNKNYQVVHLVLEVLLTNEVHLEPMILDKILACLNLKQILQKDAKVKIRNINNILLLISRKSRNNLNATNLFNLLFDAVALLLEAFCEEDIYSVSRRVDYTLGGGKKQQREESEEEEEAEEEEGDEAEGVNEEDTDDTGDDPPSEPLTDALQTRKPKRANEEPITPREGCIESVSEPQDGDTSEGIAKDAANHANDAKKRKKADWSEQWDDSPEDKHQNVARIDDYVVHVNSLFSLYFKNYKPMLNDVKIYAFYSNLFGLYTYVYDYIGYVEELAERCQTNEESSSCHFNSVLKNLLTLKGLIKKQITTSLDNITKGYFKNVYGSYLASKEELKVNYSFFLFQENERILEVMYILLNKVSNEKPSFRFDPHGDKLICPSVTLHKSKRDKLIYFFKDDYTSNEKHPFLGITKRRGCFKALGTIIKWLLLKQATANLAHVQTYFTLFLLIPHFELTIYGKNVKGEYAKLFNFATSRKGDTLREVNSSVVDSDAEPSLDMKPLGEPKVTIHRNAASYFKSVQIKIAHTMCRFEEDLHLNDPQKRYNNVHILVEYSKLIYRFLRYLNGRSNIRKDTFLFVNMAYLVKYKFDCLTNAYFELMRESKSALRECTAGGAAPLPSTQQSSQQSTKLSTHPSHSFSRERIYIGGKPHLLLYDKKFRNIFCTYPRGRAPQSEVTTLDKANRSDRGEDPIRLLLLQQRNGKKKKEKKQMMVYLNYLIYVNQMNLITVIHFDVTLRTLIFSTLFNFAKGITSSGRYSQSSTGNLNIVTSYHVNPLHVNHFGSHLLRTVMTKYVDIFGVKGLFKFLHYYIVGNVNAHEDHSMRSIHFLQNCVVIEVFKRSVNIWVDQASTILEYLIEVYTYHVSKLSQTVEAILQLREGGGENARNVMVSSSQPHRWNPIASYPSIVQNVETLEYIICSFLKSIPKKNITEGLLPHVKEIATIHLTKLKSEVTFYDRLGKGNFSDTKFAYSACKFYVLYFFNYSLSRVAMYSLLHREVKTDKLLSHPSMQHIVAMLLTSFPTVEPMFDQCVREDCLHAFFDILQMILQTLFFFLSLVELRVIDLDRLVEHLNQVLRVLKKNALAEYPYAVKKKISRQIANFFIYNHAFLVTTFRGREQIVDTIYQEFTKLLFVDIAIMKNEPNYDFLFDYFFIIRENKTVCNLLKELFSLHFILMLGNLDKASLRQKREGGGRGRGFHDEGVMPPQEEAFLSSPVPALVRRNRTLSSENHKWYEMLNLKKKLESPNGSSLCRGSIDQFDENRMMSVFSRRRKSNLFVLSPLRSKLNRDTPNLDVCILSNIFPLFNGIEKVQDNLYTLLCKICGDFSNYNVYREHILANILICFCENLAGEESPKLGLRDLLHFVKLSFQLIQKQKEYITSGIFRTDKIIPLLKLLFHIFFLYISQWTDNSFAQRGAHKKTHVEQSATDTQNLPREPPQGSSKKKKSRTSPQRKSRKVETCFVFFIKYFLLLYELVVSKGQEEGSTATLSDDHVAYLTNHMHGGGSPRFGSEEVHSGPSHGVEGDDIGAMLTKLKDFLHRILSSGGDATKGGSTNSGRNGSTDGITSGSRAAITATTARINALFLDMIEHVFVSFLLRHNFWEEPNSAAVVQVVNALRGLQVEHILRTGNEKYTTFPYSILALKIFNLANRSGVGSTSISISPDGGKHVVAEAKGEKLIGLTPADRQAKKRAKRSRRKDQIAMDEGNLILFLKLFLPDRRRNGIYKDRDLSVPSNGEVKLTSLQLYDFLYHYNSVLAEYTHEHSLHICIKYQNVIKNICTLFSYSSDDVKNILTYVQGEINMRYSNEEAEGCLYHFNIHIITLIYVISNSRKFCSEIIHQSRRPTDSSSFISLYLLLIRHVQTYLDVEVVMRRSSSVLFLLLHLVYKMSQLFVFFFVRLKAETRDGSYSNLLGFVSNYCSLLVRTMDLLKNRIRSSNDGAVSSPGKFFITHFYILNNCDLFERKKFYLYLLSHQLFVLLYEFFNIQKNELAVKSKRTLMEVATKGGYAINFFCSYVDSILYLDSRMNKLLLRNANFLVTFLRSNKASLNLPPIAFPIVIKIVDMYEFISKTSSMGEDEYEERKFLKGIFKTTLSLLENSSIQFCYTSLTDRKREIFNALSE
ncbi:hypothetical protein C922_01648 [Plasmodium inui San Antonio 1]|uniref:Uncharacterized protein n=1 Tax=Plasmodium inui San Antonio 1 TaxID=1237626 RepID=W7ARH5_9APIC|nr:hypothetical protein C922_01648 [Plasmodium inui San Antonio 1]EUD68036.1 hypothetical protein C922_01648 [Plasmodium inui San Antonio 1]